MQRILHIRINKSDKSTCILEGLLTGTTGTLHYHDAGAEQMGVEEGLGNWTDPLVNE